MSENGELKLDVVEMLACKKTVGDNKQSVDTVKCWFAPNDQDQVETVIQELIRDQDSPIQSYNGDENNIQLTSLSEARTWFAREYIQVRHRDLWWIDRPTCASS